MGGFLRAEGAGERVRLPPTRVFLPRLRILGQEVGEVKGVSAPSRLSWGPDLPTPLCSNCPPPSRLQEGCEHGRVCCGHRRPGALQE